MRIEFAIDWLAFTTPLTLLPSPEYYVIAAPHSKGFIADNAHNGYKTAWRNSYGALCQWNTERPEMRVLVQYSGKTLERYYDAGVYAHQLLQLHYIKDDTRLTRIDLAFDLMDSRLDIPSLYAQLRCGNVKCSTTKANLVVGSDGGKTLYIGSRQSDKFIRIYDKAAEQSVPGDWVRVEIEVKGDTARELGKQIACADCTTIARIAKMLLWNMVQFDNPVWNHLCSDGNPIDFTISHKKASNIKNWLADQVAPAIGKYLIEGGDRDILDELQVLVNAYIDRKSRL